MPLALDFNGDGKSDLCLVTGVNGQATGTGKLELHCADAAAGFGSTGRLDIPTSFDYINTDSVVPLALDFNGDGKSDLCLVTGVNGQATGTGKLELHCADAAAGFGSTGRLDIPTSFDYINTDSVVPLALDFNGDGKSDLCLVTGVNGQATGTGKLELHCADAAAGFGSTGRLDIPTSFDYINTDSVVPLALDFNGDGKSDLCLVTGVNGQATGTGKLELHCADAAAGFGSTGRLDIPTSFDYINTNESVPLSTSPPPPATAPGAPSSVSGAAGNGQVAVSWSAPASNGGASITAYNVTASPGGATCGTGGALTCTVSGLTNGTAYTFTVTATNSVGTSSPSTPSAPVTPVAPPPPAGLQGSFAPLSPVRILDTRTGQGAPTGPVGPDRSIDVQITGQGGVPATGVDAVVLNVTAVASTAAGYVTAWPTGQTRPTASNLNFPASPPQYQPDGQGHCFVSGVGSVDCPKGPQEPPVVVPNLVTVKVGDGGKVSLYNFAGQTNLLADVAGYIQTTGVPAGTANGSTYTPLTPTRILDSRNGTGTTGTPGPDSETVVQVAGRGGVPATATAVAVNLTAIHPTASGYVTAYPTGETRPTVSNLNFTPGQIVPNLAIVKLSPQGTITLYNFAGRTDLAADVAGYFANGTGVTITPVTPVRVLDTRTSSGPLGPDGILPLHLAGTNSIPANATAVIVNLTAVNPTAQGYLTAYPNSTSRPTASNLNFLPGQTVPNLAIVKLGPDGTLDFYNLTGQTNLIADLAGYLT